MDLLIAQSEKQLLVQKELREHMLLFHSHKEQFMRGNQTKIQAARMVKTASRVLETITKNHLAHLFSSEYLEELAFFSSIAGKQTPARP